MEDASPCQAALSMLATEDGSPGHNSHLLRMDALSPAREGGLPEAGRVTAWEPGAHSLPEAEAQHQLSHKSCSGWNGTVSSTQGSLKRLGDPAELTWETAGKVAGGPLTQHYQHPAPLAGMAAEAPPPAPRASSGPSSLVLECSPMHASPSPLILRAKLAWGSANPTKSSPGALNYSSLPPYPTLHHTVVQVGSRMDQDMGRNTALAGINRAVSAAWART